MRKFNKHEKKLFAKELVNYLASQTVFIKDAIFEGLQIDVPNGYTLTGGAIPISDKIIEDLVAEGILIHNATQDAINNGTLIPMDFPELIHIAQTDIEVVGVNSGPYPAPNIRVPIGKGGTLSNIIINVAENSISGTINIFLLMNGNELQWIFIPPGFIGQYSPNMPSYNIAAGDMMSWRIFTSPPTSGSVKLSATTTFIIS